MWRWALGVLKSWKRRRNKVIWNQVSVISVMYVQMQDLPHLEILRRQNGKDARLLGARALPHQGYATHSELQLLEHQFPISK